MVFINKIDMSKLIIKGADFFKFSPTDGVVNIVNNPSWIKEDSDFSGNSIVSGTIGNSIAVIPILEGAEYILLRNYPRGNSVRMYSDVPTESSFVKKILTSNKLNNKDVLLNVRDIKYIALYVSSLTPLVYDNSKTIYYSYGFPMKRLSPTILADSAVGESGSIIVGNKQYYSYKPSTGRTYVINETNEDIGLLMYNTHPTQGKYVQGVVEPSTVDVFENYSYYVTDKERTLFNIIVE